LQVKERILQDPEQTNIAEALYDYDAVGDITAIDTEHGEYSFGYDSLYRLTVSGQLTPSCTCAFHGSSASISSDEAAPGSAAKR